MSEIVGHAPPLYAFIPYYPEKPVLLLHNFHVTTGQQSKIDLPVEENVFQYILLNELQIAVIHIELLMGEGIQLEITTYMLDSLKVSSKASVTLNNDYLDVTGDCLLSFGKFYYQVSGNKYTPYNAETGKFSSAFIENSKILDIGKISADGTPLEYISNDNIAKTFNVVTPEGKWEIPYQIAINRTYSSYYLSPSFAVVQKGNEIEVLNFLTGEITNITSRVEILLPSEEKLSLEGKRKGIIIELTKVNRCIYGIIRQIQPDNTRSKRSTLFVLNERELRPISYVLGFHPIASSDGYFAADSLADGNRFIGNSNPVRRVATLGKIKDGHETFALAYSAQEKGRINQHLLTYLNTAYPTVLSQLIIGYLW